VLRLAARGYSNKEIAAALKIAPATAILHKRRGLRHLGLTGRSELLHYAEKQGWLADV
jgi:DNA-binding NarL/FixJ family response regulator